MEGLLFIGLKRVASIFSFVLDVILDVGCLSLRLCFFAVPLNVDYRQPDITEWVLVVILLVNDVFVRYYGVARS
jgi:hypothetical protein